MSKLSPGDKAPAFDLDSDSGKKATLKDFSGKSLVLYFYPRDNTPGCTREAQAFTKLLPAFKKAGAEVVGVSKDSVASHCGFRDKLKLKVTLLSDPDLATHKAYGAYGEKTMYGKKVMGVIRSTFLIDAKGKIARAWSSVKVDGHAEAVLAALRERA
jgi:peroxiredoxin Q/BCP